MPACVALAAMLSPKELQRARSYRQESDRQWFMARRGMLRHLLGAYLGCKSVSLCFGATPLGKPTLERPASTGITFNVSQTSTMAVLAFSTDCHLGVDVQQWTAGLNSARIAAEVFSELEQSSLDAVSADATDRFYRIWTRKESLLKALGIGLSRHPKTYSTQDSAPRAKANWRAIYGGSPLRDWTCLDLDICRDGDVWCALAASLPGAVITLHQCRMPLSTFG